MSQALIFVDSNVLIAAHDASNKVAQFASKAWITWCWKNRTGRISTQVLNEYYEGSVRAFGLTEQTAITPAHVRQQVRRLREWQPPHLDRYAVDGAWDLQDRHGLSYWNALIVSSALQQGCTHILSLELSHRVQNGELEAMQIVSPMLMNPERLME